MVLQAGHRQSVDLDFFTTKKKFLEKELARDLLETNEWKTTLERRGTIYGTLFNAKASFIAYPFFVPAAPKIRCGNINILNIADIAVMKIIAISQRGRKRDFIDLYWYSLNKEPLDDVINRAVRQYPGQDNNIPHLLKSLTYFTDAEDDVMPNIFFRANWKEIKQYFQKEMRRITRKFVGLEN